MAEGKKLTPRQAQFVKEYLVDLNATQAAIRAGYSKDTAHSAGPRLLEDVAIAHAIKCELDARASKAEITAERVLKEISAMAFYEPGALMIEAEAGENDPPEAVVEGRVIYGLRGPADIKRLPENHRRAIVGWGWDRNGMFTVKLADKSKALDQLARHLSLYNDKLEVTGLDALADRIARGKGRAA